MAESAIPVAAKIAELVAPRTLRVHLNANDNVDEVISQLNGIKQLELCADLEDDFTTQSVSAGALSSLESLSLEDLNFEKICNVPLAADSFCQLRTITVSGCHKLTNIFSFSIDRVLPKLQEIHVSNCQNMEGIFAIEREDDVNNSELIHEIQFSQLCSVSLYELPQLKSFCHRVKTTFQLQLTSSTNDGEIISEDMIDIPKSLFNEKVVFPNLETLNISNISAEKIWHNQLPTMSSSFQNLNRLKVFDCDNLKELFSSSMVNSFVQLQYLEISFCSLLEEMVLMEELKEEERKDTQFPSLKKMEISSCSNFKGFISNDKIGFPSLKEMKIQGCHKFKEFILNDKVVFPNLETLRIAGISVKKIWHNQLLMMSSSFQNLNRLKVNNCDTLKELFSSSMANSFVQLQYLKITRCSLLEEMVFMEEERKDTQFPLLKEMTIKHCPNFKGLISNDKGFISNDKEIGFPSLKAMEIDGCPKFKEFIFNDKVAVPNIEKLTISDMDNLEKIWHNQLVKDSFCKLKSLEVKYCKKLLNVFPSNICGRFSSLESLEVRECDSLRELSIYDSQMQIMLSFESLQRLKVSMCRSLRNLFSASILAKEGEVMEEAPASFLFPKLTSLELDDLPELRSFYSGGHKVESPILKTLDLSHSGIHDTDEEGQMQQPFFPSLDAEIGFPSLKEMEIEKCPKLKGFIFNDKVAIPNIEKLRISRMDNLEKIWHNQLVKDPFCKLKSLAVYNCKKLLNVIPSHICRRLLSLESLEVGWCDSLEEIFDLQELSIYDSQIMLSFENLQRLEVSWCRSLKNLFSVSILAKEGVVMEEAPARFLFPKLTSLRLDDLPKLRSFYPGRHKVEGPVLKTLRLVDCGIRDTDEEGQMQQPCFLTLALPCLEELTSDEEHITMLCQGQFPESLFDRIKILRVWDNELTVFPFGIIQRCQNLEELSLSGSSYKEIFPHGEDQTQTKIKTLHLFSLHNLKYIWKQNSKLDLIIQHLEVLEVSLCDSLINLMQPPTSFQNPSTSFQNLTSLGVDSSNSSINMGTSSVAKSLVQLTKMRISSCKKITEVIGYHGDVIEDGIIFRKLKSLTLYELPSLTSFCSWNCTLNFPSLETLTVQWCPNMKIFSQGDLTTEKLQEVEIHRISVKLRTDFDLNTAIQQSYKKANSAKDNVASSSHHFKIDQESIQQSDEEANEDYGASSSDHSE